MSAYPPLEQLLPHRGAMLLLSRIVAVESASLEAEAEITSACPFAEGDLGVPHWAGIEYMAQAAGAFDGWREFVAGRPILPGYLLGTRRLEGLGGYFAVGSRLSIYVQEIMLADNGMGAFACELRDGSAVLRCQLSVYRRPAGSPAEVSLV